MHHASSTAAQAEQPLVLIGNPNVGKSVLFSLLTGRYVTVSNYPGTTVEVSAGHTDFGSSARAIFDAPGVNTLVPQSEDERVARDVLLDYPGATVIQVADGKNLSRALFLTSQLAEMGLPIVLVLNMWDEATERGVAIDAGGLSQELGVPVIRMVATERRGLRALIGALEHAAAPRLTTPYPEPVEDAIGQLEPLLPELPIAKRAIAVMLLAGDASLAERVQLLKPDSADPIDRIRLQAAEHFASPLSYVIARRRSEVADELMAEYAYREPAAQQARPWTQALVLGLLFPLAAFFIGYKIADLVSAVPGWFVALPGGWARLFSLAGGVIGFALLSAMLGGMLDTSQPRWTVWRRNVIVPAFGFLAPAAILGLLLGDRLGMLWPILAGVAGLFGYSLLVHWREYHQPRRVNEAVGWLCLRPTSAIPILLVALWAIYWFVGVIGAGTVVGFFEHQLFGSAWKPTGGIDVTLLGWHVGHIPFDGVNYYLGWLFSRVLSPDGFLYEMLFSKVDGLIEVGVRYAVAIVLPIVGFFFLMFGLFEDSGYLPRLAAMVNRVFKRIGLTGKAVLPMVLGLGCDTMATLTARILDTPKQRFIVTLLLALVVPCSAQLGVISGMLAKIGGGAFALYFCVILAQLLIVGWFAAKLVPGGTGDFLIDLPPFRTPKLSNIIKKTFFRVGWFMKEAVPLFLIGTFAVFLLRKVGLLAQFERAASPVVSGLLGLPGDSTKGFILGFLRRDYGAIVIFDQFNKGGATIRQALIALIVITLFVPCIANFFVMIKEQGLKKALLIVGFIFPYAVLVGAIVNWVLTALGAFSGGALPTG